MRVVYSPVVYEAATTTVGWIVHLAVPALAALVVSGRLGWCLAREVLAEEAKAPEWLEQVAPLKGRWLRLVLRVPLIAMIMLCTLPVVALSLNLLATDLGVGMVPLALAALWAFCCLFKPLRAGRPGRSLLE